MNREFWAGAWFGACLIIISATLYGIVAASRHRAGKFAFVCISR